MTVKMRGKNIMTFACVGSPGVGVNFCWKYIETPMSRVSTGMPYGGVM